MVRASNLCFGGKDWTVVMSWRGMVFPCQDMAFLVLAQMDLVSFFTAITHLAIITKNHYYITLEKDKKFWTRESIIIFNIDSAAIFGVDWWKIYYRDAIRAGKIWGLIQVCTWIECFTWWLIIKNRTEMMFEIPTC